MRLRSLEINFDQKELSLLRKGGDNCIIFDPMNYWTTTTTGPEDFFYTYTK